MGTEQNAVTFRLCDPHYTIGKMYSIDVKLFYLVDLKKFLNL